MGARVGTVDVDATKGDGVRAALRYRRGQALALVLLSALVATCAAFAPTYARAVDQALLRSIIDASDDAGTTTVLRQARTQDADDILPETIMRQIPPELRALSREPIGGLRYPTVVAPRGGKQVSPVVLRAREDVCAHLEVEGRCVEGAREVVASAPDAKAWGWRPGTTLYLPQGKFDRFESDPPPLEVTVVGIYTVKDDPAYWPTGRPDGKSGVPQPDADNVPGIDDLLTVEETFAGGAMRTATVTVDLPIARDRVTLETLPAAVGGVERLRAEHPEISADQPLTRQLERLDAGRAQTAIIVPLVMTQLALIAVLALALVARGAVEQRRQDVALARLRGRSGSAARRQVLAEIASCIVLGIPLGGVVGVLLAWATAAVLLPDRVPLGVTWPLVPWLLGALVVGLAAATAATRGVSREPVADLLRAARPARGSSAVEVGVGLLALLGVVGVLTGGLSGPVTLATPALAAIAVGMLASAALPRVSSALARRAAGRGRVRQVLTAHGIGRRPGPRRVLTAGTTGVALAVFATTSVVVADGNRLARAELETGAPAAVTVAATGPRQLMALADAVRARGVAVSPVVSISPTGADAPDTLAVDPVTLPDVANPSAIADVPLDTVRTPAQATIPLRGSRITGSLDWDIIGVAQPARVRLLVTSRTGEGFVRDLGTVGPGRKGSVDVDAALLCQGECRLAGIRLDVPGNQPEVTVRGTFTLRDLALDGAPLPLGTTATWGEVVAPAAADGLDDSTITAEDAGPGLLSVSVESVAGVAPTLAVLDVPVPLPVVATRGVEGSADPARLDVLAPSGLQVDARRAAVTPVLPRVTDLGVLVGLPTLARLGGSFDGRARAELWLRDASPATLATVREVAADQDVATRGVRTTAEAERSYDESASGWGLGLAALAGVVALLLAALVMVITAATSWRQVVRDGGSLLLGGISGRAVRAALVREQVVTAAMAIVLGTLAGLVGARLTLSAIPLFADGVVVPEPSTAIPWVPVLLTVAVAVVVLVGTGLLVGRALAARTRPSAAQEVG